MEFEDPRFYGMPFDYVWKTLRSMAYDVIGTPAEPISFEWQPYQDAPEHYDKKHAVDKYSGDLENFDDCHTVQVKTFSAKKTPQGAIGLKIESCGHTGAHKVARYCEYQNVRLGFNTPGGVYPKSYVFVQWERSAPRRAPAWFVVVDTVDLYHGIQPIVKALTGDQEAKNDLLFARAYPKGEGHDGCYWYDHGRKTLAFTLDALKKLNVPYYIHPASKDVTDHIQWKLI